MGLRPTQCDEEQRPQPSRARQEAEIARDFLDVFFNGVSMALRATNRNRAVTGRERLPQSYMFFRGAVFCAHSRTARVSKRTSAEDVVRQTDVSSHRAWRCHDSRQQI
jgi:hypothetical protein